MHINNFLGVFLQTLNVSRHAAPRPQLETELRTTYIVDTVLQRVDKLLNFKVSRPHIVIELVILRAKLLKPFLLVCKICGNGNLRFMWVLRVILAILAV